MATMTNWNEWQNRDTKFKSTYTDWWFFSGVRRKTLGNYCFQLSLPDGPLTTPFPALTDIQIEVFGQYGEFLTEMDGDLLFSFKNGGTLCGALNLFYDGFIVPERAANKGFRKYWIERPTKQGSDMLPSNLELPELEKGKFVLGVIDLDVALGHRRFRKADGSSRVLASWQMGTAHTDKPYLPFGDVLYQVDINQMMKDHSENDLARPLDQDAFNRTAGLIDNDIPDGHRALQRRAAHGTHVMGIAGGAEPSDSDESFCQKVPLIVANLPPPESLGEGGAFLDDYLIYALRWMREMHGKMVAHLDQAERPPLFINISFGKLAGAKDGVQEFVSDLGQASNGQPSRPGQGTDLPSTNIIIAAGNDNVAKMHADFWLLENHCRTIDWRIQPDDGTVNFVEVWVESRLTSKPIIAPIQIDLVPPGQAADGFKCARLDQVLDLISGVGRIYCDVLGPSDRPDESEDPYYRFRYLICLTPDLFAGQSDALGAAAGLWKIRIKNSSPDTHRVRAMIQTDQSTLPASPRGRRSAFEDELYPYFDDQGRLADTFPFVDAADPVPIQNASPIRRRGTVNSYAANTYVAAIAGHRSLDGRPASYSSTGLGNDESLRANRLTPSISATAENGAAHFGVLSDGASDGSKVALAGTSMACATATRYLLDKLVSGYVFPGITEPKVGTVLRQLVEEYNEPTGWSDWAVSPLKVGEDIGGLKKKDARLPFRHGDLSRF